MIKLGSLAHTVYCLSHFDVHPQTEDYWGHVNPIGVRSCYDEGKRCAETLFFDYQRQRGLSTKVARIFNTYGPRMHPNDGRVVSNFIVNALTGQPLREGEFAKLRTHLNKGTVFARAKTLRDRFQLTRDDGTAAYIQFLDTEHWCQNQYQVTHQVTV